MIIKWRSHFDIKKRHNSGNKDILFNSFQAEKIENRLVDSALQLEDAIYYVVEILNFPSFYIPHFSRFP